MPLSKLKQELSNLFYKAASALDTEQNEAEIKESKISNDTKELTEQVKKIKLGELREQNKEHFESTQQNLSEWLNNSLSSEIDNWHKHVAPEEDPFHFYYTKLPVDLFEMVEDQIKLFKPISPEIFLCFIDMVTDELLATSVKLKDATIAYQNKQFENPNFFKCFTGTMIALANNMDVCIDLTHKLEQHIFSIKNDSNPGSSKKSTNKTPLNPRLLPDSFQVNKQELGEKINQLKQKWKYVMQLAILVLFDEISKDINKNVWRLFTRDWLMGTTNDLEEILEKIQQYSNDYYRHLKPHLRFFLLNQLLYKIVGEYVIAIEHRRMSFKNDKERNLAAERLKSDSERIKYLFDSLSGKRTFPPITSVLFPLADILDLRDKSLLLLEVSSFVRKYPDVHGELLSSLMLAREDVGRNEAKNIADEALNQIDADSKSDKEMLKLFQRTKK